MIVHPAIPQPSDTATNRLWNIFAPIAAAAPQVVYVMMSDAYRLDRWAADSRSEDVYPGVFLMRPRYVGTLDMQAEFEVVFYVLVWGSLALHQDADAAYNEQDAAYHQAEIIVTNIIQSLVHLGYEAKINYDKRYNIEPIIYQEVDSVWGYEVKLRFGIPANDLIC